MTVEQYQRSTVLRKDKTIQLVFDAKRVYIQWGKEVFGSHQLCKSSQQGQDLTPAQDWDEPMGQRQATWWAEISIEVNFYYCSSKYFLRNHTNKLYTNLTMQCTYDEHFRPLILFSRTVCYSLVREEKIHPMGSVNNGQMTIIRQKVHRGKRFHGMGRLDSGEDERRLLYVLERFSRSLFENFVQPASHSPDKKTLNPSKSALFQSMKKNAALCLCWNRRQTTYFSW